MRATLQSLLFQSIYTNIHIAATIMYPLQNHQIFKTFHQQGFLLSSHLLVKHIKKMVVLQWRHYDCSYTADVWVNHFGEQGSERICHLSALCNNEQKQASMSILLVLRQAGRATTIIFLILPMFTGEFYCLRVCP